MRPPHGRPSSSSPPILVVEGLTAGYGPSQVLFGIDLQVGTGEVVTLMGRNGMGKSTTIACLSGMHRATAGTITLAGRRTERLPSYRIAQHGLGLVPEGRQVFPALTVRENLVATASRRNAGANPWTLDRVQQLFPRLQERSNQISGQLSGGEQQMLAIGRALIARPSLMLLDEPSLGLAPMLVESIFGIIARINAEQGVSMLLVEQNASVALAVAHAGYIMETGKVVIDGDAETLAADPDVREFYLGVGGTGESRGFRDGKHYKRRKRWLS